VLFRSEPLPSMDKYKFPPSSRLYVDIAVSIYFFFA